MASFADCRNCRVPRYRIQCVVRPLQILRADGTWENIGGMK
ncbi:phage tail fiber C-terminal domain-containing protein [Escherichia coli]|nr:phage tail fiber C-terminal domain-containing protein [Escherichia coli]